MRSTYFYTYDVSAGAGKDAGRHSRCLSGLRKRSQGHGDHWYAESCVEAYPS